MSPSHNLLASAAGRRQVKNARRLVLAQCSTCGAKASVMVNGFGRLVSSNLPVVEKSQGLFHASCKHGRLEFFDLGGPRA